MKKIVYIFISLVILSVSFLQAQSSRPIVTDISVTAKNTKQLVISWKNPSMMVSQFIIYRSVTPISSRSELSNISAIAKVDGTTNSYTDNIYDYREYYYAIISIANGQIYDIILPSVNATVTGIRVNNQLDMQNDSYEKTTVVPQEKPLAEGQIREQPLPYLNIIEKQSQNKAKISDSSAEAATSLIPPSNGRKLLEPYIFQQEQTQETSGDDYLLYTIISENFILGKYEKAISELIDFLKIIRNDDSTQRALFYLGESYYYINEYESSLRYFMQVNNSYSQLTKRWIQAVLEAL